MVRGTLQEAVHLVVQEALSQHRRETLKQLEPAARMVPQEPGSLPVLEVRVRTEEELVEQRSDQELRTVQQAPHLAVVAAEVEHRCSQITIPQGVQELLAV